MHPIKMFCCCCCCYREFVFLLKFFIVNFSNLFLISTCRFHFLPAGLNLAVNFHCRYFQCEPNYGLFAPLHKVAVSSLPLPARLQKQTTQENDTQNALVTLGSNSSISSVTSTQSGSSLTPKPAATSTSQVF